MVTLGAYILHWITQLALLSTSTTIISEVCLKKNNNFRSKHKGGKFNQIRKQGAMHAQATVFEVMGPIQLGADGLRMKTELTKRAMDVAYMGC